MIPTVTIHYIVRVKNLRPDQDKNKLYVDFAYEGGRFDMPLDLSSPEAKWLMSNNLRGRLVTFDVDAEPVLMPIKVGDKSFNVTVFRPVKDAPMLGLDYVAE